MIPIQKAMNGLTTIQYYEKHLHIINQFLPMQITKTEIKVLAGFMSLSGDLVKENRFGTQSRKIIMEKLGMSSGGLGNHFDSLKKKGFIFKEGRKLIIRDFLVPDSKEQGYQFKISML